MSMLLASWLRLSLVLTSSPIEQGNLAFPADLACLVCFSSSRSHHGICEAVMLSMYVIVIFQRGKAQVRTGMPLSL